VTGALLLSQMIYWSKQVGHRAFYKFSAPCQHSQYNAGDSWQEELNFTRYEFEGARKKIATLIKRGDSKGDALKTSLVTYWRDGNNLTWYELNTTLLDKLLTALYGAIAENQQPEAIVENLQSVRVANAEKSQSICNGENPQSIESETTTDYPKTKSKESGACATPPPANGQGVQPDQQGQQASAPAPTLTPSEASERTPPVPPPPPKRKRTPAQQARDDMSNALLALVLDRTPDQWGTLDGISQSNLRKATTKWLKASVTAEQMTDFSR